MSGQLSHTPSQVIRQFLIDQSLGTDGGSNWPVYAVQQMDSPDNCIIVLDQQGVGRGRLQVSGEIQEMYGVQIVIRSSDGQTGWAKADAIKLALTQSCHLTSVTVTDPEGYGTATQDYLVYNVSHRSGPFAIPEPETDRMLHSLNVIANINEN